LFLFQLPDALLQELAFGFLLGEGEGFFVGGAGFGCAAEAAVHIGTDGVREVIICQLAVFQEGVDVGEAGCRAVAHGDGYGAIETYDGRGLDLQQAVVECDDLMPVGCGDGFCLRVDGGDCSL